jgi:hypothetical protein
MVKIDSKRKKSFRGAYEQKINLCAFFSWRLCVKCPAKSQSLKSKSHTSFQGIKNPSGLVEGSITFGVRFDFGLVTDAWNSKDWIGFK